MARRRAHFQQSDVARALRAAQQVGARVVIEIAPDGTMRLIPCDDVGPQPIVIDQRPAAEEPPALARRPRSLL